MPRNYVRKTRDVWDIETYTGDQYGWEHATRETSYKDAKRCLREYRYNEPHLRHRMTKKRIPITD